VRKIGFGIPSDDEREIAESILMGDVVLEEPKIVKEGDYDIYPVEDTEEDLRKIAQQCLDGTYQSYPARLIKALCRETVIQSFLGDGENGIWIAVDDVNGYFHIDRRESTRGAYAWYLAQPPGSAHYNGQWFAKRGHFVRQKDAGTVALSSKSLPRFKTKEYQLTGDAVIVLRWLIEQGFKSESY